MKDTLKIIVLAPVSRWEELFKSAFGVHSDYSEQLWANRTGYKYDLKVLTQKERSDFSDYDFSSMDADVFISRGTVAEAMRQRTSVPIVQIPYTQSSFEESIARAAENYNAKKIAAIGYNLSVFSQKLSFNDSIDLKIFDLFQAGSTSMEMELPSVREKIENVMDTAWEEGYQAFVCGSYGMEYARRKGYPAEIFDIDFQQAYDALESAISSASLYRGQKFQNDLCRDILNYSFEAIVSIGQDFTVEVYNSAAIHMLLKDNADSERLIPERLASKLEKMGILNLARTKSVYKDYIIEYKRDFYVVNIVPNLTAQGCSGHVILLQNLTRMDKLNATQGVKVRAAQLNAKYHFSDIIGESSAMSESIRVAETYAKNHMNILIVGQTGTGKELFAQSIHNASPRSKGPFVAINCAALPESLLESELFGYVDGAFTGAAKGGRKGFFELAHGGTLFLDEIGEVPLRIQSKLLRTLQEKEIIRLGDNRSTYVDVRIISATNRPMEQMVQAGKFREDLYYRLDVLRINIPTLEERKEDIPNIVKRFFAEYNDEYGTSLRVDKSALRCLMEKSWPGNIRQLRNVCMRAAVLADDDLVNREVIEKALYTPESKSSADETSPEVSIDPGYRKITKESLLNALRENKGNRTEAAKALGISRATLYRKIREFKEM